MDLDPGWKWIIQNLRWSSVVRRNSSTWIRSVYRSCGFSMHMCWIYEVRGVGLLSYIAVIHIIYCIIHNVPSKEICLNKILAILLSVFLSYYVVVVQWGLITITCFFFTNIQVLGQHPSTMAPLTAEQLIEVWKLLWFPILQMTLPEAALSRETMNLSSDQVI